MAAPSAAASKTKPVSVSGSATSVGAAANTLINETAARLAAAATATVSAVHWAAELGWPATSRCTAGGLLLTAGALAAGAALTGGWVQVSASGSSSWQELGDVELMGFGK